MAFKKISFLGLQGKSPKALFELQEYISQMKIK